MTTAPMASRPFPSDIPTASEITTGPDGALRLHRRLLGPWRQDRRARDVLLAEIEANARVPLSSETLVPLVDQGDVPEPWLARRFFECGTLAHRIRRTDWPQGDELLTIVATLLKAFEELDRLGLTHGDPAPCNVFLTPEGTVRLGDLCSARARFAAGPDHPDRSREAPSDRGRFLRWFARLTERCDQDDPLVRQVADALAGGATEKMKLLRLSRLAEERFSVAAPVRGIDPNRAAIAASGPESVAVSLVIGPVRDEKSSYLAAKLLSGLVGRPLAEVRARLREGTEVVESLYPDPARVLVDQLVVLNAPVRVMQAVRGPEVLRSRQ